MLALLLTIACAPKAVQVAPAPENRVAAPHSAPSGANLPTPYTADQLRAAFPAGTELKFRISAPGEPAVIQHWVFSAPSETGVSVTSKVLAEDGALIKDEGESVTAWTALRDHAAFPAAKTTRSNATVTVPAGTFQTWHYDVQDEGEGGVPIVRRYDFDPANPGPPVKMVVEAGGVAVMTMELLSRAGK
jgi:hypothetical protein